MGRNGTRRSRIAPRTQASRGPRTDENPAYAGSSQEPETGFEPVTYRLQGGCSGQLSYSGGILGTTVPIAVCARPRGGDEGGRRTPAPLAPPSTVARPRPRRGENATPRAHPTNVRRSAVRARRLQGVVAPGQRATSVAFAGDQAGKRRRFLAPHVQAQYPNRADAAPQTKCNPRIPGGVTSTPQAPPTPKGGFEAEGATDATRHDLPHEGRESTPPARRRGTAGTKSRRAAGAERPAGRRRAGRGREVHPPLDPPGITPPGGSAHPAERRAPGCGRRSRVA